MDDMTREDTNNSSNSYMPFRRPISRIAFYWESNAFLILFMHYPQKRPLAKSANIQNTATSRICLFQIILLSLFWSQLTVFKTLSSFVNELLKREEIPYTYIFFRRD